MSVSPYFAGLISVMMTVGCAAESPKSDCSSGDVAITAANKFIQKRMPDELQPNYPKPILKDDGDIWEVAYGLPEGATGGAPTVFISKNSCKIVKAISGQ